MLWTSTKQKHLAAASDWQSSNRLHSPPPRAQNPVVWSTLLVLFKIWINWLRFLVLPLAVPNWVLHGPTGPAHPYSSWFRPDPRFTEFESFYPGPVRLVQQTCSLSLTSAHRETRGMKKVSIGASLEKALLYSFMGWRLGHGDFGPELL